MQTNENITQNTQDEREMDAEKARRISDFYLRDITQERLNEIDKTCDLKEFKAIYAVYLQHRLTNGDGEPSLNDFREMSRTTLNSKASIKKYITAAKTLYENEIKTLLAKHTSIVRLQETLLDSISRFVLKTDGEVHYQESVAKERADKLSKIIDDKSNAAIGFEKRCAELRQEKQKALDKIEQLEAELESRKQHEKLLESRLQEQEALARREQELSEAKEQFAEQRDKFNEEIGRLKSKVTEQEKSICRLDKANEQLTKTSEIAQESLTLFKEKNHELETKNAQLSSLLDRANK